MTGAMEGRKIRRGVAALLLLVGAACSRDPAAVKADAVRQGDGFIEARQYARAVGAYRTAVDADPRDGAIRMKLARAYASSGRGADAASEAARAADLLPGAAEAKLLAASLMLPQGRFTDAAAYASEVRRAHGDSAEALIVWATATARLFNSSWALYRLAGTITDPQEFEAVRRQLRSRVSEADDRAAEAAYREALASAPGAVDAQIALVSFLWAAGRPDDGAELLKLLADENPQHALVNHALGAFYLSRNRSVDGERYLKLATSSGGPVSREPGVTLVGHYLGTKRDSEALAVLDGLIAGGDTTESVVMQAIAIELRNGRRDRASSRIAAVLAREPAHPRALALKAELALEAGDHATAASAARAAIAVDLRSSGPRFVLGHVLAANGDADGAFELLAEAAGLAPGDPKVLAALARMALATGRDSVAATNAREALRKGGPEDLAIVLVEALLRLRDYSAASEQLQPLLARRPDRPDLLVLLGNIHAARGDSTTARSVYQRALVHDPESAGAVRGLVLLEIEGRQFAAARDRLNRARGRQPTRPEYVELAGRLALAEGDARAAESLLRTLLAREGMNASAVVLLAECLSAQDRLQDAARLLEGRLTQQPRSIVLQTALGAILAQMGRRDDARKRFEQILAYDKMAAEAAARLAILYADGADNLGLALQLVRMAREQLPRDPVIADAFGWVLVQRGEPELALAPLQEAVVTAPQAAVYRYHLGMAYLAVGATAQARQELARALESRDRAVDRPKAQAALASIGGR